MCGPFQGKGGYTYMMGNKAHTVLYTGATADIEARVWQHKHGQGGVFTATNNCVELLWFEQFERIEDAIRKESQIKNWRRAWKVELIKPMNPDVLDLAADWYKDSIGESQRGDSGSSPE